VSETVKVTSAPSAEALTLIWPPAGCVQWRFEQILQNFGEEAAVRG